MKHFDFQFNSRAKRTVTSLFLPLFAAALAILLVVAKVPVPNWAASVGHTVAKPVWDAHSALSGAVIATFENLDSKDALVRENMSLHAELSHLRRSSFDAGLLERENERLRALLGREANKTIAAAVLTDRVLVPYDAFVIDIGSDTRVLPGALVTTEEGLALGTVTRVFANSASVSLFSAPQNKTPVVLSASSTVNVEAVGRGSGTFTVALPRDMNIELGSPVLLQSFDPHLIGFVEHIDAVPENSFQTVFFKAPVSMSGIRFVLVDTESTWSAAPRDMEDVSPSASTSSATSL